MYFFRSFSVDVQYLHKRFASWKPTKKMVAISLLSVIASLLQSAGGYLPIVGFFISPFTTLPIIIATLISLRYGLLSYGLTILLLLMLEPTELFIFPFTTGVLGIGLGWGFLYLRRRVAVTILNSVFLFLGICFPLIVLDFPVFGPMTSSAISVKVILAIFGFSFVYSFVWVQLSLSVIRRLKNIIK